MPINYEAQKHATQHILDAIDGADYGRTLETESEKAQFLYERFTSEYGWSIKQKGEQRALIDWLQGLAINIEYRNHVILENAVKWGSLPANATEKQEDKILDNYWNYMSMRIVRLWTKHKCRVKVAA